MLSYLFRQLINSFGIFFRTIRAFFTRKLAGASATVRRMTNFSRKATKVANDSFQGAAAAIKKPSKREDYIETGRLFISKSFLILALLGAIALGLLIYFVIAPFILSHFMTAHFYQGDKRVANWSGRVIVYYDKTKKVPMYGGTLQKGLLQGKGQRYNEDGFRIYEGDFVNGLYEGTGTAYYDDGVSVKYKGPFEAGTYNGDGIEYAENGQVYYKGSFAGGLYEGSGTRYLDSGDTVQAKFKGGVTDGTIQWYKAGKLWYEGSADDLTPNGFGTVYAKSGKAIYAGELDRGTLNGKWLLTLTAEELRKAFGEAALTESDGETGFSIVNEALGVSALCSFRQGEQEAQVYQIRFQPAGDTLSLLPWTDEEGFEKWAAAGKPTGDVQMGSVEDTDLKKEPSGTWRQALYSYEGYTCAGLSVSEKAAPSRLAWTRSGEIPANGETDETLSTAQKNLQKLIDNLSAVGGTVEAAQTQDVEQLLRLAATAEDGKNLVEAMTNYYTYGKMAEVLQESRTLLAESLQEEEDRIKKEQGSQEAADALSERIASLDRRLTQYTAARERAGLIIEKVTGQKADGKELQGVLVLFSPADMDVSAACTAARNYALSLAVGQNTADTASAETDVKTAAIDLGVLYEEVSGGLESLKKKSEAAEKAAAAYARGTIEKKTLYDAQSDQNEAVAALTMSMGNFTKQANLLNALTGGWVAKQYGWLKDPSAELFQREISKAATAAAQKSLNP